MRGQTTTVRPEQLEKELHKLIARNATDQQFRLAHLSIGKTFEDRGRRYQITEVYRDDLRRLIAVGVLVEVQS